MKSKLNFIMLFACVGLLISCAKDGDTGPAGPAGATGATGPQGPGATSQNILFAASDWVHLGTVGQSGEGWQIVKGASIITADIIATGAIYAYATNDTTSSATNYPLPKTEVWSTYTRAWDVFFSLGTVTYQVHDSNHSTPNPGGPSYLKIVVVPASHRPLLENVDVSDYSQVKKALHLRD